MNTTSSKVMASSTSKASEEQNENKKTSTNVFGIDYTMSTEELVKSSNPNERLVGLYRQFRTEPWKKSEICQPLMETVLEISTVNGKIDTDKAMILVDSTFRWEMFEYLLSKIKVTPRKYNKLLRDAWTTGIGTGRAIPYFWFADPELIMNKWERNSIDKMPDVVKLYRGCSKNELNAEDGSHLGISWTTSREIAEFFAFRFNGVKEDPRVVVSCDVPKDEIVAFFKHPEFECICLDICADDVVIETEEPTEYYEKFMGKRA